MNEKEIFGFITVRTSSSRLPNKCLLPFGDSTVLNHVIKRSIHYGIEPVVCTSQSSEDNEVEKISNDLGVKCFRGSLENKLKRWLDCAEYLGLNMFHTIDADDPFFDGNEMKASMKMLQDENLDMVYPTESSHAGRASVGYSLTTDIVRKACAGLDENEDTEMMWYYIEKVNELKAKKLNETCKNISRMRLTLDYEEDYWLLCSVLRVLGGMASREEVDNLFTENPDLHKVNWFREKEWKSGQLAKKI